MWKRLYTCACRPVASIKHVAWHGMAWHSMASEESVGSIAYGLM